MTQSVQEQSRTLPAIEPELHLCEIGGEMFGADLVPTAHDAALQERDGRFDGIGCDARTVLVADIFPGSMIDDLVLSVSDSTFVSWETISDKHFDIGAYVFADVLCQRSALGIVSMEESEIAVALPQADNDFLGLFTCSLPAPPQLAADIGFIHLNRAIQHRAVCFPHGCPDTMAEIPRRFIRAIVLAPDRAFELVSAHAFLGFAEQERCEEPLLQWEMGVVEDRASRDGELVVALFAVKELLRGFQFHYGHLAPWALRAIRPAKPNKNFAALFVSVEQVYNVN